MTSLTPDIRISDPDMSAALQHEIDKRTHPVRTARADIADGLEQACMVSGYACPTDTLWARLVLSVVRAMARVVRPS